MDKYKALFYEWWNSPKTINSLRSNMAANEDEFAWEGWWAAIRAVQNEESVKNENGDATHTAQSIDRI